LQYQSRLNIWVSQRAGNPSWPASGDASTSNSGIELLDKGAAETSADASGIIHRRTITQTFPAGTPPAIASTRDAAGGGFFTINAREADSPRVMRHEMGHAVFGLADEYCCDGGYGKATEKPNVYASRAQCEADFADLNIINMALLWPNQGPCTSIPGMTATPTPTTTPMTATPGPSPTPGPTLTPQGWVSDANVFQDGATTRSDLMIGNDYGMTSDIRRFRWVFDTRCGSGGC
jgi:hypothetical protein